jgi:hypothetical protein
MADEQEFYDFTHRDFRPDHKPIVIRPGIPLGPLDPSKAARMLVKAARKHAPSGNVSKAGTGRGGIRSGGMKISGGKK